jgi:hypothetical protein
MRALALALLAAALLAGCGLQHRHQVIDRVREFGPAVEARLKPAFDAAGVRYPPQEVAYLAFKDTKIVEIYAKHDRRSPWRFIKHYPVLAASGRLGPKLREGDRQVPEGIYPLQDFNANSRNHLALLIGYPNAFEQGIAATEGRTSLGGEIMIHGNNLSAGCLAMGDEAAEDFFVLTALTTKERVRVVISPTDFRKGDLAFVPREPPWLESLYEQLRQELRNYALGAGPDA